MARPRNPHPKIVNAAGTAKCWYYDPGSGKRRGVTLGPWGSAAAEAAHARLLASLRDGTAPAPAAGPTVAEVCVRYLAHARAYYVHPGTAAATSEFAHVRLVLGVLAAATPAGAPAAGFGPAAFRAARQAMVDRGWGRAYVNAQARRLRAVFRWAAEAELVPPAVWQALGAVRGLGRGRTAAPEAEPVRPAPLRSVAAALRKMPPAVAAMVRFQWLTGCRPQDACHLRAEDLDRSGPVWVYRPARHKTAWRGRPREVYVGPKAQAVLAPWLGGPGYAFSPARAVERFHAGRSAGRATPRYPSHLRRNQSKRTPSPRRPPRDRYTTGSYCKAVARACKAAGVEPFSPGQLRHNAGTRFRGRYGLEVARVLLGHGQTTTTELYAEKPRRLAMDAMRQAG